MSRMRSRHFRRASIRTSSDAAAQASDAARERATAAATPPAALAEARTRHELPRRAKTPPLKDSRRRRRDRLEPLGGMENLRRTRKPQQLAPAPRRPLRAHSRRRNRCQSPRLECCIDRVAPPSAALLHLSRGGSSRPGRSQTVGPPECDSGRRRGRRGDSASASKSGSIRAEHRDAGSCCGRFPPVSRRSPRRLTETCGNRPQHQ